MAMQVFISYKREDEAFARRLYAEIAAWGYSPWIDVVHIPPGTSPNTKGWDDAIFDAMKAAEVVIGVMTPASVASENVLDEWDYALRNQKRLFILWLQDILEADIPPRYGRIQRLDFRYDQTAGLGKLRAALASPVKILTSESAALAPLTEQGSWADELRSFPMKRGDGLPAHAPAAERSVRSEGSRLADRNRERMLRKVHAFWIDGVLEKSLHNEVLIELAMERRPGAVENPWDSVLQHIDYGDYKLPPGTKIMDVFHAMNGELLILGEPGSGKTTTLLELARHLIAAALADASRPIPVVFNLSSWAEERWPLVEWLADELNTKYQVAHKVAREWIEADALTCLLDGLDEVVAEHRNACADAINAFRAAHAVDVVVCSRIADYNVLTTKLRLQGAVVLQPLTPEQVEAYLAHFGDELMPVRALLREDAALREMIQSPLMLTILMLAYRGVSGEALQSLDTTEARRRHLFDTYVKRAFERKGLNSPYTLEQTVSWLKMLAHMMFRQGETVFYIERIQPDWLSRTRQRLVYAVVVRLMFGISGGLAVGVGAGVIFTLAGGMELGRTVALGVGVAATLIFSLFWGWGGGLATGSAGGMTFGLTFGLVAGIALGSSAGWMWGLAWGLILAMIGGLIFGVIGALIVLLTGRKIEYRDNITIVEILTWSWSEAFLGLGIGLVLGIVGGVVSRLVFNLEAGLWIGGILGIASGLALMPGFGLAGREVEMRTVPNQGIRRSVRLALQFGLSVAILMGVVAGLTGGPLLGLIIGLVGALAGFMTFGGIAFSQHILLRLMLYVYHEMPWNYARFLDFCADRILLRKVGGGYIFIHRYLLEYFAALETAPPTDE